MHITKTEEAEACCTMTPRSPGEDYPAVIRRITDAEIRKLGSTMALHRDSVLGTVRADAERAGRELEAFHHASVSGLKRERDEAVGIRWASALLSCGFAAMSVFFLMESGPFGFLAAVAASAVAVTFLVLSARSLASIDAKLSGLTPETAYLNSRVRPYQADIILLGKIGMAYLLPNGEPVFVPYRLVNAVWQEQDDGPVSARFTTDGVPVTLQVRNAVATAADGVPVGGDAVGFLVSAASAARGAKHEGQ